MLNNIQIQELAPKMNIPLEGVYFKDEIEAFIRNEDPCPTNEYDYGDGLCDGYLNNSENCFDGGDCCGTDANYDWCDTQCYPGMECVCQCRA